jgi:hypothetical protein
MQRHMSAKFAAAALAVLGAFAAATSASAHDAYDTPRQALPVYRNAQPEVRPAPRVVYATPQPVYVQHAPQPRYAQAELASCGAPRWNPDRRYMPGQVVRRQGTLYVATGVSASVWNVNSPPEWTPSYWVPAVCGR